MKMYQLVGSQATFAQTVCIKKTSPRQKGLCLRLARKGLQDCVLRFHRLNLPRRYVFKSRIIAIHEGSYATYVTLKIL